MPYTAIASQTGYVHDELILFLLHVFLMIKNLNRAVNENYRSHYKTSDICQTIGKNDWLLLLRINELTLKYQLHIPP